jgi:hypothetical protein
MKIRSTLLLPLMPLSVFCLLATAPSLQACAVCWGSANSKVTDAMGFAILFLLAVVGLVLAGIVVLFIVLARRARNFPVPTDGMALPH